MSDWMENAVFLLGGGVVKTALDKGLAYWQIRNQREERTEEKLWARIEALEARDAEQERAYNDLLRAYSDLKAGERECQSRCRELEREIAELKERIEILTH